MTASKPPFLIDAKWRERAGSGGGFEWTCHRGEQKTKLNSEKPSACSIASWEADHFACRTSATGYIPIYYAADAKRIIASGSLQQCLSQCFNERVYWPNIVLLLILGHFTEGMTPFSAIRTLPLASRLDWSEQTGLQLNEDRPLPAPTQINPDDALGAYEEILAASLREMEDAGQRVMGLSGGRDSRHIALSLRRQGQRMPRLITSHHYLGSASSRDVEVAGLVASRLRVPLETILPPRNRITAERWKNSVTDFQSLSHSWGLGLATAVGSASILFDGMNGGVLFGRSSLVRFVHSQLGETLAHWNEVKKLAMHFLFDQPAAALRGFIAPEIFCPDNLNVAREQLAVSLEKYAHFLNPLQAFLYYNHVAGDTSAFAYRMMKAQSVVCPLDHPMLVAWALGLPWRISSDHTFQARAIRKWYPELADVPFEDEYRTTHKGFETDAKAEHSSVQSLLKGQGKRAVTKKGAELLLSGKASLRQIQVFVYLTQMLHADDTGRLEALPDLKGEQHF